MLLILAFASSSSAQDCTAWLNASDGNDANPGTQILPLRSFEHAFETLADGAVVCMAAGEYFYGEDADGIRLEQSGKSMSFVLQSFAGASEVRFSESEFVIDIGTGVVSLTAETVSSLVVGSGIVNIDDPALPQQINFVHTLGLLSGRFEVSGVDLTLEPSVGNPDWNHPTNPVKSPPQNARIEFSDGIVDAFFNYEAGERVVLVSPSLSQTEATKPIFPASLADLRISFTGSGITEIDDDLTLSDADVAFEQEGTVRFAGQVRVDLSAEAVTVGDSFFGELDFAHELVVFNSGVENSMWFLDGTGDLNIAHLISEGSELVEPTQLFEWESTGDLTISAMSTSIVGSGTEPELGISALSGRIILGGSDSDLSLLGPLLVETEVVSQGNVILSDNPFPLSLNGLWNLEGHSLSTSGDEASLDIQGSLSGIDNSVLTVSHPTRISGGGSISVPVSVRSGMTIGTLSFLADVQVEAGGNIVFSSEGQASGTSLEVLDTGTVTLQENAQALLSGDFSARTGSSLDFAPGSILATESDLLIEEGVFGVQREGAIQLTGATSSIVMRSPASSPSLEVIDGAATLADGSAMPELLLTRGSFSISTSDNFSFLERVTLDAGTLSVTSSGEVSTAEDLLLTNASSATFDATAYRPGGALSLANSVIDFGTAEITPLSGSTTEWVSDRLTVLPLFNMRDSDATVVILGQFEVSGPTTLSSGEVLIENGAILTIKDDIERTGGIFEPVDGGILVVDGEQIVSINGFSASVLPSLLIRGAGANLDGNTLIFGDLNMEDGLLSHVSGSTMSMSGSLTQSGGTIRSLGGSIISVGADWIQTSGLLEMENGELSVAGDVLVIGGATQTLNTDLVLSGSSSITASFPDVLAFGTLRLEDNKRAVFNEGLLSVASDAHIGSNASLLLSGADILLGFGAASSTLEINGVLNSTEGWVRLEGSTDFTLAGSGSFGGLRIDLADDASSVGVAIPGDELRVIGDVHFESGSVDLASHSLIVLGEGTIPEVTLNLSDEINSPGTPDGRGFEDLSGPLNLSASSLYDLRYVGSVTTIRDFGDEFGPSSIRNLSVDAVDPVNSPPIFGLRSSNNREISGRLRVSEGALLKLDSGTLSLSGEAQSHFVNGSVSGDGTLQLLGSGSPILNSSDEGSRIDRLLVDVQSTTTPSVISGIGFFKSFQLSNGLVRMSGVSSQISESLEVSSGTLTLNSELEIGPGGLFSGIAGTLIFDNDSSVLLQTGAFLELNQEFEVSIGSAAAEANQKTDGFFVVEASATIGAPGGIPRLILSEVGSPDASDNVFLSRDLEIDEWLELVDGDLFVGEYNLTISGGSLILDSNSDPFDGDGDTISGDFSGVLGSIRLTGATEVFLGNDVSLQSIDLVIDAGGGTISLTSLTSLPQTITLSNRGFTFDSGTLDLGLQDLILNASIENVLTVTSGQFDASSEPTVLAESMPELHIDSYFPFADDEWGEIIIGGGGNTSISFSQSTTVPNLRLSGTTHLSEDSAPLNIGDRLVFGQAGSTFILDSGSELVIGDGASIVRRGRGTISSTPSFAGEVSVFYELDDGNVTGTDTDFSQTDIFTGVELPLSESTAVLGVMAGNTGGTPHTVRLSSDLVGLGVLAVFSGGLDLSGQQLTFGDNPLLAIDQIDVDAPGMLTGSGVSAPGVVDLAVSARFSNVDLTHELFGSILIGRASFYAGNAGAATPRTLRLTESLSAQTIAITGFTEGDSFRLDGNDLAGESGISLNNITLSSAQVADVLAGSFQMSESANVDGPIRLIADSEVAVDGHFGGLLLDAGANLSIGGTISTSSEIQFSGSEQTWTLNKSVEVDQLSLSQTHSGDSPPRVEVLSTAGPIELDITNSLNLESGILNLGQHSLRLSGSNAGFSRVVPQGQSSHVEGRVVRSAIENSTDSFLFPVGSEDSYRPFSFSLSTPLLSASDFSVKALTSQAVSRNGLPLVSSDGQTIIDAAPFSWLLTSSVNFAQSQPVTVTAQIQDPLVSSVDLHRLISRDTGGFATLWAAISGTPLVTQTDNEILLRNVDARGLFVPQGIEIGIGLPTSLFSSSATLQFINLLDVDDVVFEGANDLTFTATSEVMASPIVAVGFDGTSSAEWSIRAVNPVNGATLASQSILLSSADNHSFVLVDPGAGTALIPYSSETLPAPSNGTTEMYFANASLTGFPLDISIDGTPPFIVGVDITAGEESAPFSALAGDVNFTTVNNQQERDVHFLDLESFDGLTGILVLTDGLPGSGEQYALVAVSESGEVIRSMLVTALDDDPALPASLAVNGNFPNPFSSSTRISFDLPSSASVQLRVFDMLGRQVSRIDMGQVAAGANQTIRVDAPNLASGAYLYVLEARSASGYERATGKMLVVK